MPRRKQRGGRKQISLLFALLIVLTSIVVIGYVSGQQGGQSHYWSEILNAQVGKAQVNKNEICIADVDGFGNPTASLGCPLMTQFKCQQLFAAGGLSGTVDVPEKCRLGSCSLIVISWQPGQLGTTTYRYGQGVYTQFTIPFLSHKWTILKSIQGTTAQVAVGEGTNGDSAKSPIFEFTGITNLGVYDDDPAFETDAKKWTVLSSNPQWSLEMWAC